MRKCVAAALMCGFFICGPQSLAGTDDWIDELLNVADLRVKLDRNLVHKKVHKGASGIGSNPSGGAANGDRVPRKDISGTGG